MKKIKILTGLFVVSMMVLMSGCNILTDNKNTSDDKPNTKEKISQDIEVDFQEDGLTYDDYRIDINDHEYVSGPVARGTELTLHTYGVTGYKETDGLVYPFLEQKVTDSKGKVIYEESDLIPEDADGIDAETAAETYTYIDVDNNYKSGQTYRWVNTYSDRQGDAMMGVIVDFVVE